MGEGDFMLQINNISKTYRTGDFTQDALDDVSLTFRNSEFVAVLGPSGSGKTTLLNIIGGLDRYDSGDLFINGVSTRQYAERDWDSYRNHSIGFVFQSYNLIPHQSILANVELALAISGVSPAERRERARKALDEVGLIQHIRKRPNQLSGGQMQRVAIARALINDPDILLADEPTGAIDTETSVQIMELLKKVAGNRLVIMVTHNSELAQQYATRIVRLKDGQVAEDSDPPGREDPALQSGGEGQGKAAMSRLTALALSFSNLMTKKGRTLLTSFAGSIGIIGIALILALSNGVSGYITDIQRDTMLSYPISIDARTFDFASIMAQGRPALNEEREIDHDLDAVYSDSRELEVASRYTATLTENNLTAFKKYLDDPDNEIRPHLGENGILYSYEPSFSIYVRDEEGRLRDAAGDSSPDRSDSDGSLRREMNRTLRESMNQLSDLAPGSSGSGSVLFQELLPGEDGALISQVTLDNYDLVAGTWPAASDEVLLVMDENNEIPIQDLHSLGLLPAGEYEAMLDAIDRGETLADISYRWDYAGVLDRSLYMLPASYHYRETADGTFELMDEALDAELLMGQAVELKLAGIIRPAQDAAIQDISGVIGYTSALTDRIIDETSRSPVVKAQLSDPATNVLNGLSFQPLGAEVKVNDVIEYIRDLGVSDKAAMMKAIAAGAGSGFGFSPDLLQGMDEIQLAAMADRFLASPDQEILLGIYEDYISVGSYEENMAAFGYVNREAPSSIRIYAASFDGKDAISQAITSYNAGVPEEDRIMYTDLVALMTSSVTDIIDVITYVLIAFVAVSLVVSSIMIGIITFISVVERTKEIGILRALGASRGNIAQVFNAETFVIGLFSGILGVGISYLLTFPINRLIHSLTGNVMVNASLPFASALVLIFLSIFLTMLGGLIPSRKAARKDPVAALRTE